MPIQTIFLKQIDEISKEQVEIINQGPSETYEEVIDYIEKQIIISSKTKALYRRAERLGIPFAEIQAEFAASISRAMKEMSDILNGSGGYTYAND